MKAKTILSKVLFQLCVLIVGNMSMWAEIKPLHTVTFSVNGNVTRTSSVEEDQPIIFPTAAETPTDASEFEKTINGMTFVGWVANTIVGSTDDEPTFVTSATMGENNITYYAVYATVNSRTEEFTKSYGFEITSDTNWIIDGPVRNSSYHNTGSYSGKINTNNSYVTFKNKVKVKTFSFAFTRTSTNANYNVFIETSTDNSTWTRVKTYEMSSFNSDGTFTTKSLSFDGDNEYYVRFHCLNTTAVRYVDDITIIYDEEVTYISNYCTTVSALPLPKITMEDVEMTWGETGKSVVPSATIGGEPYNGAYSFYCDDANLTVNSTTGELYCNVPSSYTVTATIAATEEHQAAQTTCTVTVKKKDITLSFAHEEVVKMVTDETKTFTETAIAVPTAYDGTITYAITGSGSANIESSTGAVTYTDATGINTITATAQETTLYNGNTASYMLFVKTTPTINVSNQTLAYGATYTPTITGGEATFTSVPEGMITSDGNVITAAAVGTSTITVITAANDTYLAGEASFILTATAPEGLHETPGTNPVTVFYESFTSSTGSIASNWAGSSSGNGTPQKDNDGWDLGASCGGAGNAIKLGASGTNGTAETPSIDVTSGTVYTLTFKAAPWGMESTSMSLTVIGGTVSGLSTENMNTIQWNNLSATITATSSTLTITFDATSQNRFFLDEVKLTRPGDPVGSVSATIASSGYGSYCSEYPLNLPADNEDYKAYIVTNVTGSTVTFTQISGEIKGGVPFFLYGKPGDYDLSTAASSDIIPANNMLQGTLAPTYITTVNGDYTNFGLSQGAFRKIESGILPAHKAYLPIETSKVPSGSGARMTIVFEDDTTTGINAVNGEGFAVNGSVYDLQGRKVAHPTEGLYIVNGKKIFVK